MQDTPDLSKIISLIMQNPTLISEISALAKGAAAEGKAEAETVVTPEKPSEPERAEEAVSITASEPTSQAQRKARRKELLYAMKPYLSDNRRTAIDSMSSILDILDVMMKRET